LLPSALISATACDKLSHHSIICDHLAAIVSESTAIMNNLRSNHWIDWGSTSNNNNVDRRLSLRATLAARQRLAKHRAIDLLTLSNNIVIKSAAPPNGLGNHVQCLAIEKIDYRYLLSGELGGAISLFDLESSSSSSSRSSSSSSNARVVSPAMTLAGDSGGISSIQWYPGKFSVL
jgi:hypothetical protein